MGKGNDEEREEEKEKRVRKTVNKSAVLYVIVYNMN